VTAAILVAKKAYSSLQDLAASSGPLSTWPSNWRSIRHYLANLLHDACCCLNWCGMHACLAAGPTTPAPLLCQANMYAQLSAAGHMHASKHVMRLPDHKHMQGPKALSALSCSAGPPAPGTSRAPIPTNMLCLPVSV